jgi:hypothetical protein
MICSTLWLREQEAGLVGKLPRDTESHFVKGAEELWRMQWVNHS